MSISLLCCSGSLAGGGSERQLWQLACHLSRHQFRLAVYLLYRKGVFLDRLPADTAVFDFWSQNDVRSFRLPGSIHAAQVRHLESVIRESKIQLVYDRTFHMTLVTAPACKRAGVPRISVIVSPPSEDFVRAGERFAWLKKRRLRAAYSDPSCITVAVSDAVADDAALFYRIDRERIVVVPSPIDIESVGEKSKSPTGQPANADQPTFCVVGRLSSEKGQALALDAFAKTAQSFPYARLQLVGDGPDWDKLVEQAHRLRIADRIEFVGFQENPYPTMVAAAALLIPSDYEGLPNVALEAMALRCPVIATRSGGAVEELLGDGKRGQLVDRGDADALAGAMTSAMRDGIRTEQLDAAESWVHQHHSLPGWISRMESLFEQLHGSQRGGE